MNACPSCTRPVPDGAPQCPHCGHDLLRAGGGSAADEPVARVGDEALEFSHSGTRHLLGYGHDFFGIWDREAPGGPVERFPRTDEGWREAWLRFAAIEPHHAPVGLSGRDRPAGPAPPPRAWPAGSRTLAMASPGARLGARLVDTLILAAVFTGLVALGAIGVDTIAPDRLSRSLVTMALAVSFLYETPFIALRGQTPGKMALRVRVVEAESGGVPGWRRALIRWGVPVVASVVPFGPLVVYLWLLWDSRRQGLHDKAAGTLVVPA